MHGAGLERKMRMRIAVLALAAVQWETSGKDWNGRAL